MSVPQLDHPQRSARRSTSAVESETTYAYIKTTQHRLLFFIRSLTHSLSYRARAPPGATLRVIYLHLPCSHAKKTLLVGRSGGRLVRLDHISCSAPTAPLRNSWERTFTLGSLGSWLLALGSGLPAISLFTSGPSGGAGDEKVCV